MPNQIYRIGYPQVELLSAPMPKKKRGQTTGSTVINTPLWGDYAKHLEDAADGYIKVKCRGDDGFVKQDDVQTEQLLELNFADVGQGDGCFLVIPDHATQKDKFILIDAGEGENMLRFLNWRFNIKNNPDLVIEIEYMIITHSDSDHYNGFAYILASKHFRVKNILHNGIIERAGDDMLGPEIMHNGIKYLSDLRQDIDSLKELLDVQTNRGRKNYPALLFNAYNKNGVTNIRSLKKGDQIPGYGENDPIYFQVLGPVTESINGKDMLRVLGDEGETKNGHSVIIKLHYRNLKMLLGGDLNHLSQAYLATHYTGYNPKGISHDDEQMMIEKGREVFESDIAKSCHHGSDHFLDAFYAFINPVATIISSGDNEKYTHPRPETLGTIGKNSRGARPLIFSTELARSGKDYNKDIEAQVDRAATLKNLIENTADPVQKELYRRERRSLLYDLGRTVAVYGMVTVRTDGQQALLVQKKEQKDAGYIYWAVDYDPAEGKFVYVH